MNSHECRGAEKESCWYNGHLALCEVEDCRKRFNARWGCVKHGYRDAYNLRTKADFFGHDYEALVKKFAWMNVKSTDGKKAGLAEGEKLAESGEQAAEKKDEKQSPEPVQPPKEVDSNAKTGVLVKARELTPQQSWKAPKKYKERPVSPEPEESPREEPKSNAKTRKREQFAAAMDKKMAKRGGSGKKPERVSSPEMFVLQTITDRKQRKSLDKAE